MQKVFWIIILSCLLFVPSLFNFFSGDDWFHLRLIQINSVQEFFNFFSFIETNQTASFYRPLSTQVLFFVFYSLFGLNAIFYHFFGIIIFGFSLFLVYRFIETVSKDKNLALITLFLYGISVTHFTRLYFISAFQEIIMTIFVLLTLIFYLKEGAKENGVALLFFILALLSKETAVIVPFIIVIMHTFLKKKIDSRIFFYIVITGIFVFLRLVIFPKTEGESYIWDFNLLKMLNTLFWYLIWSIGAPEFLVDYVSSGLKIVPRFFEVLPIWSLIVLVILGLTLTGLGTLVIVSRRYLFNPTSLLGISIFMGGLLPVIFLPWHKFTLELTIPLIGFCLTFGFLLTKIKKKLLRYSIIGSFIVLNLLSYSLTYKTHYSISRAKVSAKVMTFLQKNYPTIPENSYLIFKNNAESSQEWGVSKQIAQSISFADLANVVYKKKGVEVYFEDIPFDSPQNKQPIEIDSLQFLK